MHAVALAAGKLADAFLLVGSGDVELRNILACVHLPLAERDGCEAVRYLIEQCFVAVQAVPRLVDIAELDRLTALKGAGVRRFLAGDQTKQCCLTGAVRADDADDTALRKRKFEAFKKDRVAESL